MNHKRPGMEKAKDADQFLQLLAFLCARYKVDRKTVFVEYSSRPPPPLKGERLGYYEGLLS
ncbi:MAG TPA: hypothetical protein VFE96_09800, partial [Candidatus Bathyarchaeia archaeon]|nr:hypothetical protein [Candidatus Bathyarchaeia archaeon]